MKTWKQAKADEKPAKERKISPAIEECDQFVHFFILYALLGGLDPKHGQLNGLYIKTEFGITCIDMWYDKEAREEDTELRKRILDLLKKLDEKCKSETDGVKRTLSDTF